MSFAASIQEVYQRIFSNPLTLFIYVLVTSSLVAPMLHLQPPLDIIANRLATFISNDVDSVFERTVATFLLRICQFLIKYSKFFDSLGLYLIPVILDFSMFKTLSMLLVSILTYPFVVTTIQLILINNVVISYSLLNNYGDKVLTLLVLLLLLYALELLPVEYYNVAIKL